MHLLVYLNKVVFVYGGSKVLLVNKQTNLKIVNLTRGFSTSNYLSLDEARRVLERFQWLNQNKQPYYKGPGVPESPILKEMNNKVKIFVDKQDKYISYQERYITFVDGKVNERLHVLKTERPQGWTDLENRLATLESNHNDRIFDLEVKYKAFAEKPGEYYKEALNLEFSNKKKLIQTFSQKEEYLNNFMENQPLGDKVNFYKNYRAEFKGRVVDWVKEIRAYKKEVEEYITSNTVNLSGHPGGGPKEGGSGINPSEDSKSVPTDNSLVNTFEDTKNVYLFDDCSSNYLEYICRGWNYIPDSYNLIEIENLLFSIISSI